MSIDNIMQSIEEKASYDTNGDLLNTRLLRDGVYNLFKIANPVLGFLLVLLTISIPIIITLEVVYIAFPLFRTTIDKIDESVNAKLAAFHRTIGFVFRDARHALKVSESRQTGRSAMWEYLVIKIKSVMFLTFLIALVINGWQPILGLVYRMFSGVFNLLRMIGNNFL